MPDLDLDVIAARVDAATAGPWEWSMSGPNLETEARPYSDVIDISHDHGCACRRLCELEVDISDEDRAFIAHARSDVPELLAAVRELRAEKEVAITRHRELTSGLGYGDDITEPMAPNDVIIAGLEEERAEAREWRESEMWRQDCAYAGHDEGEDCEICDPILSRDACIRALRAEVAAKDEWIGELEEQVASKDLTIAGYGKTFFRLTNTVPSRIWFGVPELDSTVHDLAGQYLDAMEAAGVRIVAEEL